MSGSGGGSAGAAEAAGGTSLAWAGALLASPVVPGRALGAGVASAVAPAGAIVFVAVADAGASSVSGGDSAGVGVGGAATMAAFRAGGRADGGTANGELDRLKIGCGARGKSLTLAVATTTGCVVVGRCTSAADCGVRVGSASGSPRAVARSAGASRRDPSNTPAPTRIPANPTPQATRTERWFRVVVAT
jgi:hypothetical protein